MKHPMFNVLVVAGCAALSAVLAFIVMHFVLHTADGVTEFGGILAWAAVGGMFAALNVFFSG